MSLVSLLVFVSLEVLPNRHHIDQIGTYPLQVEVYFDLVCICMRFRDGLYNKCMGSRQGLKVFLSNLFFAKSLLP